MIAPRLRTFTCVDDIICGLCVLIHDLCRNTHDSLGIHLIMNQAVVAISTPQKIEHLVNINRRESVRKDFFSKNLPSNSLLYYSRTRFLLF